MLQYKNLEELVLTGNYLQRVNTDYLPPNLKVCAMLCNETGQRTIKFCVGYSGIMKQVYRASLRDCIQLYFYFQTQYVLLVWCENVLICWLQYCVCYYYLAESYTHASPTHGRYWNCATTSWLHCRSSTGSHSGCSTLDLALTMCPNYSSLLHTGMAIYLLLVHPLCYTCKAMHIIYSHLHVWTTGTRQRQKFN